MRNLLSLLVAAAILPAQAAVTFDELDFSKVKKDASGKIVFVPIRNTTNNSGVFWYSDLQQKLINPVKINQSQRKITLRAFPASHENGSYNSFVSANNLLDQRVNLMPANAVLCEASSGLKAKLAALNFTYTVKPTTGSYPGLCWLELKYFATAATPAEAELVSYIQQNQVLNINYRITTPATPAVMMDVPALVSQLEAANLLKLTPPPEPDPVASNNTPTPAPVYQGELYPVLFASSHYATDLYRSDLSINDTLVYADWYRFLTLFHVNVDNKITLDPVVAGQKLEVVAEIPGGTVTELQLGDTLKMLARIDCKAPLYCKVQLWSRTLLWCNRLLFSILFCCSAASALPQNAKMPLLLQECLGCHQQERHQPVARFPNGFGKWQDSQCYGCHQEISEVAANLAAGKKDPRYLSLPVSDERLKVLAQHPMPYLQAPRDMLQQGRTDFASLLQFLQRPHGRCEEPAITPGKAGLTETKAADTPAVCSAPAMMAYPSLSATDLQHFQSFIGSQPDKGNSSKGQQLFAANCASCHQHSNKSGYNTVALSLFASGWLRQYQHKAGNNYQLNAEESTDLTAFFNIERSHKQQQLDNAVGALGADWQQLKARQPAQPEVAYLWQHFWRDANCVHCHGIEGRAKDKFDTSEQGIKRYLKAGKGAQLYYRLKIRQLEQQHGIGAAVPGMPMTGAALPDPFINLVGGWLKAGCPDQQGVSHCADL